MSAHTPGKIVLATSNSWRRFVTVCGHNSVCEPITQTDGHPDLHFRNGGADGPDAKRMVACWNACDSISTDMLESANGLLPAMMPYRLLRELNAELLAVMRRIEPHLDAIVCYASTCGEYEPNEIVRAYRDALAKAST